jgi:hypothetical protein
MVTIWSELFPVLLQDLRAFATVTKDLLERNEFPPSFGLFEIKISLVSRR